MKLMMTGSLLLVLVLVGCAVPATPTPMPTATLVPPTATPAQLTAAKPTDTPPPTATEPPTATLVPTSTPRPTETFTPAPTATATHTPLPTATSTPATETYVIFSDDFSASKCSLTVADDANRNYGCENGEYTIAFKNPNYGGSVWYSALYDDAVIEVDAHSISGDQVMYGIVFRRASSGEYYLFGVSEGDYVLKVYSAQKWSDLISWAGSPAVKTGTANNHLRVVAQGKTIAIYANDQFLDSYEVETPSRGYVGLYTATSNPTDKVAFDNFTVSRINRPLALQPPREKTPTPAPITCGDIPAGMGGLLVLNGVGDEMNYDVAGQFFKIPADSYHVFYLPPGRHTFSYNTVGKKIRPLCDTAEGCTVTIEVGKCTLQNWGLKM